MYSSVDVIQQIKSTLGADATREYIFHRLEKTISKKRFPCPFCGSKDGFCIYEDKNNETKFKCHAVNCEKEGDLIDFEQYYGNVDRKKAIRVVAEYAGISLDKLTCGRNIITSTQTPSQLKKPLKNDVEPIKRKTKPKEPIKKIVSWDKIIEQLDTTALTEEIEKLFELRNFGKYTHQAAEIARHCCLGIYQNRNLAFRVLDESGKTCGLHLRSLPKKEKFKGFAEGSQGKGYFFFDRQSEIVFVVEGVIKAIAIACLGYSAICIYGSGNVDYCIPIAKKLCPGKRLVLWLDSGTEEKQKKAMQVHTIEGIFWQDAPNDNYGPDDLLAQNPDAFADVVQEYLEQLKPKYKKVKEALSKKNKVFNVISGPTGLGKTHDCLEDVATHIKEDERVSFITDTKTNINTSINVLVKDFDIERKKLARQVAGSTEDSEEKNKAIIKKANVAHYYWLGFKGNRPETYALCGYKQEKNDGDIKIHEGILTPANENEPLHIACDEFHKIFDIMTVDHDLCSAYRKRKFKKNWWLPTEDFQGVDESTFVYWPELNQYGKFEYWRLPEAAIFNGEYTSKKDVSFLGYSLEELQKPDHYLQLKGNIFFIDLPQNQIPAYITERLEHGQEFTEVDYLKMLYRYTYQPRILCQFPIDRKTGKPLSREELDNLFKKLFSQAMEELEKTNLDADSQKLKQRAGEKAKRELDKLIQKPTQAAYVPKLVGWNLLPLIQIMQYSTTINALSATLDQTQMEILKYACDIMNWKLEQNSIDVIPIQFPITTLITKRKFEYADLARLQIELCKSDKSKALFVVWKRTNLNSLWLALDAEENNLDALKKVSRFVERDYCTEFKDAGEVLRHIWTYSGASILQGQHLYGHNFVIIDGALFIPLISLALGNCLSKEDLFKRMQSRITARLTQIVGRLLRDIEANQKRTDGQTVQSNKRVVIIIHNAPDFALQFQVDPRLCAKDSISIVEDDKFRFSSTTPKKIVESLTNTINKALDGMSPENWAELDTKEMIATGKAQRHITPKHRLKISPMLQNERHQGKLDEKYQDGVEMFKSGKSYREISRKLNLTRHPEIDRKIRRLFIE